jgi:hypothetical protein
MAADGTAAVATAQVLRAQLEQRVARLRAALRTWQLWDAEYEGLKEEITARLGEADEDDDEEEEETLIERLKNEGRAKEERDDDDEEKKKTEREDERELSVDELVECFSSFLFVFAFCYPFFYFYLVLWKMWFESVWFFFCLE